MAGPAPQPRLHPPDHETAEFERYLQIRQNKGLLRFITCGSVDDGKSTLIGRLLYEAGLLLEDQLAALEADSKKVGTQGGRLDFALVLDGLSAEREQGITIDVAYRIFATDKRTFILADTPGHEQYTRNMVTGASTADAAVLLVDARKGVVTQTRRHSYLAAALGIRHVLLAVNKMDLVDYAAPVFEAIRDSYRAFARQIGLPHVECIPVSALRGDNILTPSERMRWYHGPTVVGYLETVEVDHARNASAPFRMPVQWVNRPHADFRGFAGLVTSGIVRPGDRVRVQPSGRESRVAPAGVADQFEATIIWLGDQPMLPGRPYWLKIGAKSAIATIRQPKYRVNVDTLEHLAARRLELNEIGVCNIAVDRPIAFDAYRDQRDTGGFILIDRLTNDTVGAGLLHFALRRSQNLHWQATNVDKRARARRKAQTPCVLWFTGLSGAGKSTIANLAEETLHARGLHTYLLDGDNVRHGLNRDLGFTDVDRVENIRRVAEVAKLMVDAGLIVLVSFISPFRAERRMARDLVETGEFIEIFVDTPLAVAEARDPKGLYRKARRGELKNFTGIDSPYEPPEHPEIRIDTTAQDPAGAVAQIIATLEQRGII